MCVKNCYDPSRQCENGSYGANKGALINLQISSLDVTCKFKWWLKGKEEFFRQFFTRPEDKKVSDGVMKYQQMAIDSFRSYTHTRAFYGNTTHSKACEGHHHFRFLLLMEENVIPSPKLIFNERKQNLGKLGRWEKDKLLLTAQKSTPSSPIIVVDWHRNSSYIIKLLDSIISFHSQLSSSPTDEDSTNSPQSCFSWTASKKAKIAIVQVWEINFFLLLRCDM